MMETARSHRWFKCCRANGNSKFSMNCASSAPCGLGELKNVLKPITNTALTNALKELEADELIQRIQYNEMPLRVEYSLTEKGRDLLPVFYAISQWGMKYIP